MHQLWGNQNLQHFSFILHFFFILHIISSHTFVPLVHLIHLLAPMPDPTFCSFGRRAVTVYVFDSGTHRSVGALEILAYKSASHRTPTIFLEQHY